MIKKLLTISLIFAFTASYSQIELREHNKTTLINGTTITVDAWKGASNAVDIPVEIDAKSIYASSKTIKTKKIEISSTAPTSKNALCWGSCSLQELWNNSPILLSDPLSMTTNQVILFSGHVYPFMAHGATKFRYVWFDVSNPSDSAYVDVIFNISEFVSVDKIERENVSMNIFPNPATSNLNVNLILDNTYDSKNVLEIKDLLGRVVYKENMNSNILNAKINTSEFNAGIYFVSLISNNKAIKTEKVVITK